ncbi:MAG: CPBP family intramembrane metalloprotease [Erysipelotrichaceae bacterium]|nr:CPBP family intramembrane metalloprotease [Erysipelotrichaceae bacterium]
MKKLLQKIYTERFRWYDELFIVGLISFMLVLAGQIPGMAFADMLQNAVGWTSPLGTTFTMYIGTIGVWVVMILHMSIFRHRRPILKAIGSKPSGNTVKYLLIGLLIGFGMNFFCALVAMINKDIHLSFDSFDPLAFLLLLFAVFVQSSSEELVDRAFYFQTLKKGYRSKWVAIIGNALIFALMHATNPGINSLALLSLALSGIMYSLAVFYFDSLWMAFGIHTGWNFTQSILLGLPNSGIVVPYSIFRLDTANAVNSFAYDIDFGIENSIVAVLLEALVCFLLWYFGKKRNKEPLDVYADYDFGRK